MFALPTAPSEVALVLAPAIGGLLALAFAVRQGRPMWAIVRGRTIDVFDLTTGTTGPIRIAGTAQKAERALEAPFTGRPSLAVRYEVLERRDTRNGTSWVEVHSGTGAVPFLLEDDTGTVLVEPDRVRLGLDRSDVVEVEGGERPPAQIREFIERSDAVDSEERTLDLRVIELNVGDDRRYVEHRLEPGETATVFGEAVSRTGRSVGTGQVNAAITAGANPVVVSETTPYRTVLRVFWPVLLAGAIGVVLLAAAVLLALG